MIDPKIEKAKMKMRDDEMFRTVKGPLGVVRVCLICGHRVIVRTGRAGVGRGYGMREGNKARGHMIQHFKEHQKEGGGKNGKK